MAGRWSCAATGGPGDARRLAEQAVADRLDVVTVFGGDGTTMQAAAALVGTDVALGVVPGGTGNLLAGNLRIPTHPVRAAKRADCRHSAIRSTWGAWSGPTGCTISRWPAAPATTRESWPVPARLDKHRWRFAAYVATTLRLVPEMRSIQHLITVDGVEYEAQATMVLVANCGEVIPPFVRLRTGISPHDGLLDVVVVRADSFIEGCSRDLGVAARGGVAGYRGAHRVRPGP